MDFRIVPHPVELLRDFCGQLPEISKHPELFGSFWKSPRSANMIPGMITYTTTDVAKILKINSDGVRARIATGELQAANIAKPGSVRPKYRVTEEQLRQYLESKVANSRQPRKSRKKSVTRVDYLS